MIKIDENAGFCFGVVKAIATAEEELTHNKTLYCLGDIVHNNAEVARLSGKGLVIIDGEAYERLRDTKVLIRAHGEPPETYRMAKQRNIQLVDATCPIVLALQKKIRQGFEEMQLCGGQVVIFGKQGHAEVIGLNGQTDNSAIIISNPEDIGAIDFARPIRLYSQTTKSKSDFEQLVKNIESQQPSDFVAYNTLCNRVSNRATQLEAFAKGVDLVIFVSGSNSSNGRYLYDYCRRVQPHTIFLSSTEELESVTIPGLTAEMNIGITGATSTPRWLMEEIRDILIERILQQ